MSKKERAIFGDFQTPLDLARSVTAMAVETGGPFTAVVEPTCGLGNFLLAATDVLGSSASYYGFDINEAYVESARRAMSSRNGAEAVIECQDFYEQDWQAFFQQLQGDVLVIGNPPWVTNAALGTMGGGNLPGKTNFQRHRGFAAKTGKANFDISEWMLIRLIESLQGRPATVAMLCKAATARKVLRHCWRNELAVHESSVHAIDATRHFGVSVDACLFITHTGLACPDRTATLYRDLSLDSRTQAFGMANGEIVSDLDAFRELRDLDGVEFRKWRSGVKHDAAKIMELEKVQSGYRNGLGETWELEPDYIYPLLKSSDVANGRLTPRRYILLTQRLVSDSTDTIASEAPQTWQYLLEHSDVLDRRRSSIYAKRARFAVFGVGPYTFSPWKVAISGMYKNLRFSTIGGHDGKPILVDDTCYFIPCDTEEEAQLFAWLLNSDTSMRFLHSLSFFDSKRAVTIDVLRRVDLKKLAKRLGKVEEASRHLVDATYEEGAQQLLLFEEGSDCRTNPFT